MSIKALYFWIDDFIFKLKSSINLMLSISGISKMDFKTGNESIYNNFILLLMAGRVEENRKTTISENDALTFLFENSDIFKLFKPPTAPREKLAISQEEIIILVYDSLFSFNELNISSAHFSRINLDSSLIKNARMLSDSQFPKELIEIQNVRWITNTPKLNNSMDPY